MPLSNLVVCQMLCIYFNDSMKVLRYIYFQKNLETLVPVSLFFIVAFIKSYLWLDLKKSIAAWGSPKTQCSINYYQAVGGL